MTAQAFQVDNSHELQGRQDAFSSTRYGLDVIANDVADVITAAGGWLFDRAMSGWDVTLLSASPADVRALQILGIRSAELTARSSSHALAVAADALNAEPCVRDIVVNALDRGDTEVILWGDTWPPDFHHRAHYVRHRLSAAARAFKAHALTAAELPGCSVSRTEVFRGGTPWNLPYEQDLLPVSE